MKTYIIQKYSHSSNFSFRPQFFTNKLSKRFKFDSSCEYDLRSIDQFEINKLFGWSQMNHNKNSCRFGWTWNLESKKMEIYSYCYVNKERITKWLCDVDLETWYIGEIWLENGNYYFRILNDDMTDILGYNSVPYDFTINIGYFLYPYFGGFRDTPHQMKIFLK